MAVRPNFCLSRVDNPSSHGWMVRIKRGKERITKFFGDNAHKGKRLAQYAARDFRDAQLKRLVAEGKLPRAEKLVCRQKRNRSGVIGISRFIKKAANGKESPYYAIYWTPSVGVAKSTTISIQKYGEERAFKMAVALRNQKLKKRHGSGVFRKLKSLRDARQLGTPDCPPNP